MNYLLVFIGGGLGSVLRLWIGQFVSKFNIQLPLGTLLSNIISCSIFAVVLYVMKSREIFPAPVRFFVLIGICGGLSTFSSFSFETFELIKNNMYLWATVNVVLSVLLCLVIFITFAH